jgi:uncharacterized protein (DUF4415 family)
VRSSKKVERFTSEQLRTQSAAGLTGSDSARVRVQEPDLTDPAAPESADQFRVERLRRRGRPAGSGVKSATSLRIDRDVLAAFRATGRGWQTRMNEALRVWIEANPRRRRRFDVAAKPRRRLAG